MSQPKTIVLFSTKGGVGKTLIASNLAVVLAKEEAKRVCLIDLDIQAVGDMARMFDLRPQKAMVDWIHLLQKQPEGVKKEDFLIHTVFGFDFLPAVLRPQQSPHLDPTQVKQVLNLLEQDYDYLIIDAGKSFSEIALATLSQANLILLILTSDIHSVYQAKFAIEVLQTLHFPLKMLRIVLNRAGASASISWQEIRTSLPIEIIAKIPSEGKAVSQSVNRGIPIVIDSPRAKTTEAIKNFAKALTSTEDLYLVRQEIDGLRLKEAALVEPTRFWQAQEMTEILAEPQIIKGEDELIRLKRRIHTRLIEELNLKRLDSKIFSDSKKTKELRDKADLMVTNFLAEEAGSFLPAQEDRKKIVREILDEALGLGPLEDLLVSPMITDIMVNNKDEVYIEQNGRITLTDKKFISNDQVRTIIERIIAPIGRRIDESVPMVDARLSDGSRVNAIIPPLSLTGPTLTIRKFRKEKLQVSDLVGFQTLNQAMADFIRAAVICRKNIIVSGGTGSGKTTILNVLSSFIPDNERIITIEDAAELKLHQTHWVRLESRPPNIEGKGMITIRDLFRNTLRMRPDRIIIGECRGMETLDMLQAMNTGHDGSMTTLHANSTQDALIRMDSLILMSGVELPIRAIREMIASAIDLVVHTARLSDGSRKITQITELGEMQDETRIKLHDIFVFRQTSTDSKGNIIGGFQATGYKPSFIEEIKIRGIHLPENVFQVT